MQVDVLTLRYDPTRGVLDETALREFTRDKVVLAVRDHFYQVGSTPHLTLVIEYRLPAPGPSGASFRRRSIISFSRRRRSASHSPSCLARRSFSSRPETNSERRRSRSSDKRRSVSSNSWR